MQRSIGAAGDGTPPPSAVLPSVKGGRQRPSPAPSPVVPPEKSNGWSLPIHILSFFFCPCFPLILPPFFSGGTDEYTRNP